MNKEARSFHVLLVEDNPGDAILLQESLAGAEGSEFRVSHAKTLAAGLKQLHEQSFDAILLDLSLPDSQGLDTLAQVCAAGTAAPVIVLTGMADGAIAIAALHKGAQDYLVKGQTDGQSIAKAIRFAMERKQTSEALRKAKEELEQQVQARTAELSQTVETLRKRTEQLRHMASELTLAEQRERQRMAKVLHDHLQQLLVGAQFWAHGLHKNPSAAVKKAGKEIADLLAMALESSRTLTGELSPPSLQEIGLGGAVIWLGQWMREKHGLTVEVSGDDKIHPQSDDMTMLVFQAVRELLLNVVKHAKVKRALVEIARTTQFVEVTVQDRGAGFDPAILRTPPRDPSRLGLAGIQERLHLAGGSMEIQSAPGQGSRFTVRVPDE